MNRIKIIYFIGSLRLGGAEKQVVELALGLDKSRYDIEICCINQGGPMVNMVRDAGIPVRVFNVSLPYGKFNLRSYPHLVKNLWQIYRYVKKSKPDIIHGYLFTAYVVGILCGSRAKVPILISSRRSLGLFKDDKPWRQKLENYVNEKTHVILVNASAIWEDMLVREKHCKGKIHLVYNGVDLEKYHPGGGNQQIGKEWGVGDDELLVGVVANLIHYKGHLEIVEAAWGLKDKFPGLKFVFVGRDGGMKKQIEQKIAALDMRTRIVLAGSRQDVDRIIPLFDVMVLASHEEGFSNVLLEGMACEVPIVATNVGGSPESVVDGDTGLIVPPRNPKALAEALEKLISDPDLRERLGKAGRRRVKEHFSREKLIRTMDEFYQRITSQAK